MKIRMLTLLLFAIISLQKIHGQDTTKIKKIKILPVPTFGYSPETSTYVGVVSLFTLNFYQDILTRSSNAKIELNYTWNRQLILESQWNYFFKKELWYTRGVSGTSKYPDLYYGIGPNSSETDEIKFESNRVIIDIEVLRKLKNKLFVGLGLRYLAYSRIDFYDSFSPYRELSNNSNYGGKVIILNDARNNILNPHRGNYMEASYTLNRANTYYSQLSFDLRKYYSLHKGRDHTFAARFYNSFVFGDPPFYDYSLIGGDKFARGYFYGRYRDKHLSTLQLEYRFDLIWRFGLATFGGLSIIYPDFAEMDKNNFKPNAGMGIRFLVDKTEKTNLRLDYAIGANGQSGFYVSFGESF